FLAAPSRIRVQTMSTLSTLSTRFSVPSGRLAVLDPRNRAIVHLVRTVGDAQGADHGVHLGQRGVGRNAGAAEGLDSIVDHLKRHTRRGDLDLGDLGLGALGPDL